MKSSHAYQLYFRLDDEHHSNYIRGLISRLDCISSLVSNLR